MERYFYIISNFDSVYLIVTYPINNEDALIYLQMKVMSMYISMSRVICSDLLCSIHFWLSSSRNNGPCDASTDAAISFRCKVMVDTSPEYNFSPNLWRTMLYAFLKYNIKHHFMSKLTNNPCQCHMALM